jgi:hypothetical protein
MKTREQIITDMCYTWRHDYGLNRHQEKNGVTYNLPAGMTDDERQHLWNCMAQIFDNNISPYMEFKK